MGLFLPKKVKSKSGQNLVLRSATLQDAGALNELVRHVFATSAHVLTTPEEFKFTDEQQAERIKTLLNGPGDLLLLLEANGVLVGNLDFHQGQRRKIAHRGHIGMSIHSEWRNQGLGRIMLEGLVEWMREQPVLEQVYLSVLEGNTGAIELYKRVGFKEIGRNERGLKDGDKYIPEIFMTLEVR